MESEVKRKRPAAGRIGLSALAALTLPLTVAVLGPCEIFLNNRSEFSFAMGDFLPLALLVAFLVAAPICAALIFAGERGFFVGMSLTLWLTLSAFLQGSFLNLGASALAADGLEEGPALWFLILDLFIWIALGAGLVFAALRVRDRSLFASLAVIAFVAVLFIQLMNLGLVAIATSGDGALDPEGDGYKSANAILTDEGMFEVSEEGNVIVIVLDRFDVSYYKQLVAADSDFFAPLDGFTYYNNHISLYSRTYPAVAYMLTGVEQDFEDGAEAYFARAYRENTFFSDLRENGYGLRLYTEAYYAYRNANVLLGIAENVKVYSDYTVNDPWGLCGSMMALSVYRYAPNAMKPLITVSSADFGKFIAYDGDAPRYVTDDATTAEIFREEGVTVRGDGKKQFTFLHLNGCHNPYTIDEAGNRVENGEALPAIRGVFGMIFSYFDRLKQLGLYEDATIIITGDHASAISDRRDVEGARVTALFVKRSGDAGTPLAFSSAPVCQGDLLAEIVSSAGLSTTHSYGVAVSDVGEKDARIRKYYFEKTLEDGTHQIVEYRVTGDANDFGNWEIVARRDIGKLYK